MVVHQLDLFGGPLKPPKKIKVDDDESLVEMPVPVVEIATGNNDVADLAAATETHIAEAVPESAEDIITNDIERNPGDPDEPGEWNEIDPFTEAPASGGQGHANSALAEASTNDSLEIQPVTRQSVEPGEPKNFPELLTGDEELASNESSSTAKTNTDEERQVGELNEPGLDELADLEPEAARVTECNFNPTPAVNATMVTGDGMEVITRVKKPQQEQEEDNDGLKIPPDEELFKRQYYSMRETSAMFGVNQSLLRFWENEFDILQPKKNKKGDRYFRPVDIKNLVLIYHLLRVRKFTLDGAKDYLQKHKKAGDTFELVKRLEKLKSFLLELKASL